MNDLAYIIGLMRENYSALGFIPQGTIETRYIAKQRYLLIPSRGYLLHGVGVDWHISQAVIDYDFRSRGHGFDMVAQLIERAKAKNARRILLRCANDLESNSFWLACGFELVRDYEPATQRKRKINLYELQIQPRLPFAESVTNRIMLCTSTSKSE